VDVVFLDDAEGIKGAAKKAKPDAIVPLINLILFITEI
tara:strand:+ start:41 stop:154 length:114 start_codon:yes stop_codon:yes gene_type:complete